MKGGKFVAELRVAALRAANGKFEEQVAVLGAANAALMSAAESAQRVQREELAAQKEASLAERREWLLAQNNTSALEAVRAELRAALSRHTVEMESLTSQHDGLLASAEIALAELGASLRVHHDGEKEVLQARMAAERVALREELIKLQTSLDTEQERHQQELKDLVRRQPDTGSWRSSGRQHLSTLALVFLERMQLVIGRVRKASGRNTTCAVAMLIVLYILPRLLQRKQ
jgi:hypothetical protein